MKKSKLSFEHGRKRRKFEFLESQWSLDTNIPKTSETTVSPIVFTLYVCLISIINLRRLFPFFNSIRLDVDDFLKVRKFLGTIKMQINAESIKSSNRQRSRAQMPTFITVVYREIFFQSREGRGDDDCAQL